MKRTGKKTFNKISPLWNRVFSILLGLIALLVLIPMALVVIVSFSSETSIANNGYTFFPSEWTLQGYDYLLKMGDQLVDSYVVTIFHTFVGTLMSLVVSTMYAYVLAQKNFRHRGFFTWLLCFTMLFSGGLVPSYIVNVRYLGIGDTIWIFLLPSLASAFNIIILRTFINTTIPESLFEAATIDGASHMITFARIALPLMKAGIATIALFNVIGRWNDWFTGMLYISNPKLIPLQTLLTKIQNSLDFIKNNSALIGTPGGLEMIRNLPGENMRMACTILIVLPVVAAYPFFQRYFVRGLTIGSIKG